MGKNKNKNNNNNSNYNNNNNKINRVFLLDIRNDSCNPISRTPANGFPPVVNGHDTQQQRNHHGNHQTTTTNNTHRPRYYNNQSFSCETLIHRRIIEMYKCRDDFEIVDLNVRTSQPLTSHTRVDIANALQHMKTKCGKPLRRISADVDYIDFSVHEFVLLHCLAFDEIQLTSNPEEQTTISEGIAMSLRHALTANKKCIRFLEISHVTLTDETCGILCDAFWNAFNLETLRLALIPQNMDRLQRRFVPGLLEGLVGKKKLEELHLSGANAHDLSGGLSELLSHKQCEIKDLYLGYDWSMPFDSRRLFQSFALSSSKYDNNRSTHIQCNSLLKLQLNGINLMDNILPSEVAIVFPNIETLSISCAIMPKLGFLDLPEKLLPQKLQRCYFPCTELKLTESRKLVKKIPTVIDIPDFQNDSVVRHYLDWTKCGRAKLRDITKKEDELSAALWPYIFQRAYRIMDNDAMYYNDYNTSLLTSKNEEDDDNDGAHIRKQKNRQLSIVYSLLHDYQEMNKQNYKTVEENGILFIMEANKEEEQEQIEEENALVVKGSSFWNRMIQKRKEEEVEEEPITGDIDLFTMFGNQDDGDY